MTFATRPQLLYVFALFAGATYYLATLTEFSGADMTAWKGTGVAMLALWAARHAESVDGWIVTAVLACGVAGDVLIETHGLVAGAVAFLVGHLFALWLYAHDRWARGWPIIVVAATLVSLAAFVLTGSAGVAIYAAALGAMAGAAALGRFERLVALGAWLFVASDLLIFARLDLLADSAVPDWLIWPLYFGGQAAIAWGVVTAQSAEAGMLREGGA